MINGTHNVSPNTASLLICSHRRLWSVESRGPLGYVAFGFVRTRVVLEDTLLGSRTFGRQLPLGRASRKQIFCFSASEDWCFKNPRWSAWCSRSGDQTTAACNAARIPGVASLECVRCEVTSYTRTHVEPIN